MRSCAVASLLTNALKNVREIQPLDVSFEPVLYLSVVQSYGKVLRFSCGIDKYRILILSYFL